MPPSRPLQTYESTEVTVTFDSRLCMHSEKCVRGLPAVFDPTRKRWIRPDAGATDEVLAVVSRCPTGALRARRAGDGDAVGHAGPAVTITVSRDGPLLVRGPVRTRGSPAPLPTPTRPHSAGAAPRATLRSATAATPQSDS